MKEKDLKNALMAPLICSVVSFALLTILGAAVMLVPKSRLERDAEALAEVQARRVICNLTPTFSGFDAVAGKYDFEREAQQKFKRTYIYYFSAAYDRILAQSTQQQSLLCKHLNVPEDGDRGSVID
ncbi:hypothetical protein HKX54_05400 [Sulfitobacter sp. M57]|uniref:hypothetical protein n=1 Tax=unclassified Sulfitobacter TaxID=196795 RepID=UPI0023E131D1|nr:MULTISPECIES: hypothetical protein [unclassified Sulfitobacter]MDF3413882.1 hypothetical protein [Sulfitobacter sp. KE5]MDF3420837.1 hypothetical protein [Sulfitobacter sp. KE43]MDF3432428.1 hypothetical protein [Sulfitobacter sp. KE42]MDF3458067.1 hypothetical protein [Sulfitobacter sp. S74]MDF3461968.1 hypothetical protein [Sulfitobacter sp. Ks18]